MRPAEFTTETIIEAGQALRSEGRNVSGFALRQKIGGGNPNRLKQVWDKFAAEQPPSSTKPSAEDPPNGFPVEFAEEVIAITHTLAERIAALSVELNNKATKAAERRVLEISQTADKQRLQSACELADVTQKLAGLEVRLVESQTIRQTQSVEAAQLRARLAMAEHTAKQAEPLRDDLECARRELAEARETIAKQAGQLETLAAQYTALLNTIQAPDKVRYAAAASVVSGTAYISE